MPNNFFRLVRRYISVTVTCLFLISIDAFAYVTLPSTTHSAKVGETVTLNVPKANYGYISKAVWACSSSSIEFLRKDEISAEIKVKTEFSGYVIVELVCVESYVDEKGFTRAITYYKTYKISCTSSGGGVALRSFSFDTIELNVGDEFEAQPKTVPSNASIELKSVNERDGESAYFFIRQGKLKVRASIPGRTTAVVTSSNNRTAKIEVIVRFPEFGSLMTTVDGEPFYDTNLMKSIKNMEKLFISAKNKSNEQ